MNTQLILNQLNQLNNTITELKQLSKIEHDLILHKLRIIYENMLNLEVLQTQQVDKAITTTTNTIQPQIISNILEHDVEIALSTLPEQANIIEPETILNIEPEQKITSPETFDTIKTNAIEAFAIINETANELKINTTEPQPADENNTILADKYITNTQVINEIVTKNNEAAGVLELPVADIETSIGLNEKFLFIRELFSGNAQLYAQTIDKLNYAGSYENALLIIKNNFSWNFNAEITLRLLDLIRRRYL